MATTKTEKTTAKETESKAKVVFTKNTILHSAKYANRRDLLSALLQDGQTYTMNQVDALITDFMKKGKVN